MLPMVSRSSDDRMETGENLLDSYGVAGQTPVGFGAGLPSAPHQV
jgi:hypothetical protein